ncbi:protein krueppel-like isoform X2 [Thrips palmi]|uniref:Protein krueppel-like isoform X2 n=1 Tax=Thrips palmi TaxID=161013 RepID=A0A6P8ZWG5_THRPL|nr:protein krueppel-like isoform X2 [Thrips palmi]
MSGPKWHTIMYGLALNGDGWTEGSLWSDRGEHNSTQCGRFECFQCGNVYRWKGNLMAHLRVECGKEPNQHCPYCPQRFKHKSHLKRHFLRLHPEHRWPNK